MLIVWHIEDQLKERKLTVLFRRSQCAVPLSIKRI